MGLRPQLLRWRVLGLLLLTLLGARFATTQAIGATTSTTFLPLVSNLAALPSPAPAASLTPEIATPTLVATVTPTPSPTVDTRFSVIIENGGSASSVLSALGLTWWYSYGQNTPGGPGTGVAQISLRPTHGDIVRVPLATLQAGAAQNPGGYWIIGNEPNIAGQDNVTADQYATELEYYYTAIKGTDPTAKIVGPNVLDFDLNCTGCATYTSGHTWIDGLRSTWASTYGGEPPFDVWGIHAYDINWTQLPMTNWSPVQQDLVSFSSYLAAIPADQNLPIWATEFGVIWAYDGRQYVNTGCQNAPSCSAPSGNYDQAAINSYLAGFTGWLQSNGATNRIDRWFLYIDYGQPGSYTTAFAGIALMNGPLPGASITASGQVYAQLAAGSSQASPAIRSREDIRHLADPEIRRSAR